MESSLLFIVGAVLLFLTAVVLMRTAKYGMPPKGPEPALAKAGLPQVDADRLGEKLAAVIRCPTVSGIDPGLIDYQAFRSLHQILVGLYPGVYRELKCEVINAYSLLFTWPGRNLDLEPVMLIGHLDVVPADPDSLDRWKYSPFSGEIAEGSVWGRGALDNKGCVVAILEAVEVLLEEGYQPERTVLIAFGHDEEIGGIQGAAKIAEVLEKRSVHLAVLLDEGVGIVSGNLPGVRLPVAMVGVGEKGYLSLVLESEGTAGHSAIPPRHSAIGRLSEAICRVEAIRFPRQMQFAEMLLDKIGWAMPFGLQLALANRWLFGGAVRSKLVENPAMHALMHTSRAVTMIQGGIKDNVLPQNARAVVNFRLLPGDTLKEVYERVLDATAETGVRVKPAVGDTLAGTAGFEASRIVSPQSPNYQLMADLVRIVYPEAAVAPLLVPGMTDSRHYTTVASSVFRFLPARLQGNQVQMIHGINENIPISELGNMAKFYAVFIRFFSQ